MLLTAEPIDARQALQCNLVSRVVAHERLMEEAETMARQILRNSQHAVRSAKQTILDTVGKPLDEQLRNEAWNAYTCADPKETLELLGRFYEKTTQAGRAPTRPVSSRSRIRDGDLIRSTCSASRGVSSSIRSSGSAGGGESQRHRESEQSLRSPPRQQELRTRLEAVATSGSRNTRTVNSRGRIDFPSDQSDPTRSR